MTETSKENIPSENIQKKEENPKSSDNLELEFYDEKILAEKKILIVGAGGLGCELLKLLVINGFKQISIIDMDKIERSNLNRQFLFDHSSIGKFKSEIAVENIKKYRQDSSLKINSYIGNIKDENQFGNKFYSNFDLILNALDNNDARYYINSICIKLNIPLINSGSEGIYGMVNWHIRGLTPCFACQKLMKDEDVIPICSIRLKPEKLEHSVAWAKVLFEQIFIENNKKDDNNDNNKEDKKEKLYDENMPKKNEKINEIVNYAQYMFYTSIKNYKELMDESKEDKNKKEETNNNKNEEKKNKEKNGIDKINPEKVNLLDIIKLLNNNNKDDGIVFDEKIEQKLIDNYSNFKSDINSIDVKPDSKNISEITKLIEIFISSYSVLSKRPPIYEFNKEDDDIINFIYSATNLRCYNFKLELESKFKIKQIAGKIIAAIAYTNNIVSSIEVLEAKKFFLIKKNPEKYLKMTIFGYGYNIASVSAINSIKNKNCPVCSEEALKEIDNMKCYETEINFEKEKLDNLLEGIKENILKQNEDKNININVEMNKNLIYTEGIGLEEDEKEEFDENKNKKINEFIIKENNEKANQDENKNKFVELIVSTWNDKFEENSKKSYSIKIKNIDDNLDKGNNIKFKELFLNKKRKRSEIAQEG